DKALRPRSTRFLQVVRKGGISAEERLHAAFVGCLLLKHESDVLAHLSTESVHAFFDGTGGRIYKTFDVASEIAVEILLDVDIASHHSSDFAGADLAAMRFPFVA